MAFQRQRIAILIISSILLISACLFLSCNKDTPEIDQNTLAVVGGSKIDTEDFIKRFKDLRSRTGVEDNGQVRRSVLKSYIAEELLIHEARERGYDNDSEGKYELERIRIQKLLDAYHKKVIYDKIRVDENELHALFIRMNTKLKARHLYAPTYEKALSIYQKLRQGRSFDDLAHEVFDDPVLRNSGGLLGYFTVDEMEPAFEEAAYDLEVGEISKPVRTNDGYSIIRVEDRQVKPLLTEYEYAKHRSKLLPYWKKRKSIKATQLYVDSLKRLLNASFNEPVLQKLFHALKNDEDKELSIEQKISSDGIEEIKNEELVRSDMGIWEVEEFQGYAKYTSEKQQGWIRSEENLKDFISGLIVRSYMLSEAEKLNLHQTSQYENQVAEDFDTYLLERIQTDIHQEIEIPEDSLLSYYNQNPQRFANPPKVNLREIVLENADDTVLIAAKLKEGADFSKLARRYSVRRWSAENGGELGYLTSRDLGKWASLAFSMNAGSWMGPIKMDGHYVFLECIDKISTKIRSFEEVRDDVEETVRMMWWEREKGKKLNEIRNDVYVKSFPEKLRKIRLN